MLLVIQLQAQLDDQPFIPIPNVTEIIYIDGKLDEESWKQEIEHNPFWQYFPTDTAYAKVQTELYMVHDEHNLYIAGICWSIGKDYVVNSYRRDFRAGGNDNITFLIDPFNDGTNAFMFGTNPLGVKREGLISGGGASFDQFITTWDNKWKCEAKITDEYWSFEMAIPYSTLRFNPLLESWSINAYRFDTQANERSSLVRIPQNQTITNLAYTMDMIWEGRPDSEGAHTTFIPYVSGKITHDIENMEDRDIDGDIGGDAKIAISSSLNLDLTFNPDFSQVEVDRQITNLDRFEIFFPEKRQFFIENADLFSTSGFSNINPFFSRRIGIARDTIEDERFQNRIYAGARLSGKLNENLRVGLLSMQTAGSEENGLPSFNYSVASLQQKVFSRSNVNFIFVNRQALEEPGDLEMDKYNRVIGVDYNLATDDNLWQGKVFLHKSFTPNADVDNQFAHGLFLRYSKRNFEFRWQHEYVGEGYDAQVGFVRRSDYFKISPEMEMSFYQQGPFNKHGPQLEIEYLWEPGFGKTDHEYELSWGGEFHNTSRIRFTFNNEYVYLFDSFDPTGTDSEELPEGNDYNFNFVDARFNTDFRKPFSFRIFSRYGNYFNGKRFGLGGSVRVRYQPYGEISINYNYNHFDMPHLEETKQTFLIGPRIDLTFSKSIFLTTFIQYNTQIQNTNINTRFQWRFAPVSDFFLVYTDNYFTGDDDFTGDFDFRLKNRAIVAKLTYWLNL